MRKFVWDETSSNKVRGELPEFTINARFLYFLNKDEKTYGQPDQHLAEVAKKFGFTIITRDNGLVTRCIGMGIDVVKQFDDGKMILVEAQTLKEITSLDLGKPTKFNSKEEHLKVLGMENL